MDFQSHSSILLKFFFCILQKIDLWYHVTLSGGLQMGQIIIYYLLTLQDDIVKVKMCSVQSHYLIIYYQKTLRVISYRSRCPLQITMTSSQKTTKYFIYNLGTIDSYMLLFSDFCSALNSLHYKNSIPILCSDLISSTGANI